MPTKLPDPSPPPLAPRARHSRRRGFTLLEVMMGLAVLGIVAGAMFGLIQSSLVSAAQARQIELRRQEVSGFLELVRTALIDLPGDATLYLNIREDSGKNYPELIFQDAPGLLSWGSLVSTAPSSALSLQSQTGGLLQMAITTLPDERLQNTSDRTQPASLQLLGDLTEAKWQFYIAASQQWSDDWPAGRGRPDLIQLTLGLAGDPEPLQVIFWIPKIEAAPPPQT